MSPPMIAPPLPTLVVGYGRRGHRHAQALRELGGSRGVAAVVDARADRRARAQQELEGCPAFETITEALASGLRPVCAVVAAAVPEHHAFAAQLLQQRIPTLVEKPICATSAEGRALLAVAADHRAFLTVGHVERFNPAVLAARKVLEDGMLGSPLQIAFRRLGGMPANPAAQGDVLADVAVHDFDLARFLTGAELTVVSAVGHPRGERLEGALVLGPLTSGAAAHFQVSWRSPVKIRRVEIIGSAGYLEIDLINQKVELYRPKPAPECVEFGVVNKDPLPEQLAAFWRAVAGREPPPVPAEDAVRAVELAEQARALLPR